MRITGFPTWAVVPPLLVAFVLLAYLHWRGRSRHNLLNPEFLMMVGGIVLMFTQVVLAGSWPTVSLVCFPLALLWLAVALLLLRRHVTQG